MKKQIIIRGKADIDRYMEKILASAEETQINVCELSGNKEAMDLLYRMKFEAIGCDPLNSQRRLNLIEQLNQTFTYMASLKAARYLFANYNDLKSLTLNLGTRSGWDIETNDDGGVIAEVFAAVSRKNNRKLEKDIKKVSEATARRKFVFFMCPRFEEGTYPEMQTNPDITVVSLGYDLP